MILVHCIEDKATFKCLGCTKEKKYQDCLRVVRQKQVPVPVRLLKEDDNPVDKQAVAFQCQQDEGGGWTTFGCCSRANWSCQESTRQGPSLCSLFQVGQVEESGWDSMQQ